MNSQAEILWRTPGTYECHTMLHRSHQPWSFYHLHYHPLLTSDPAAEQPTLDKLNDDITMVLWIPAPTSCLMYTGSWHSVHKAAASLIVEETKEIWADCCIICHLEILCNIISAWKSSLKTGKRLRLNWTKTRKDRKKQDWTRLKTGKDRTKPVFAVETGLN